MAQLLYFVALSMMLSVAFATDNHKKQFPPNKHIRLSDNEIKAHPKYRHHISRLRTAVVIPTAFDARKQWPTCTSITTIRDQGQCGTCWAVSSASVLSDRLCVASSGAINLLLSANQAAACPYTSYTSTQNCQAGGDPTAVYKYSSLYGIPTGGQYNSGVGCVPYPVSSSSAPPLTCATSCTNTQYTTPLPQDLKIVDSYWINYQTTNTTMTAAQISTAVNQMQTDIVTNGPLTATMTVYSDFQTWVPSQGPYAGPSSSATLSGGHAVRIIGWNTTAAGVPYWLIANSWNTNCGDQGVFWIKMGLNVVGIEASISAPIVSIPNTCSSATFCGTIPIDQAVVMNISSSASPVYLFQGNCTQQVSISAGKLTTIGAAVPLSKLLIGAPTGPITASFTQSGQLWIVNAAGQAGANCNQPSGATKYTCSGGNASGRPSAQTSFYSGSTLTTWSYYGPTSNPNWIFGTQGNGVYVNTLLTANFTTVTSFLNLDGTKMAVFGTDSTGKSISGVMAYPAGTQTSFTWVTQPGPATNLFTSCSTATTVAGTTGTTIVGVTTTAPTTVTTSTTTTSATTTPATTTPATTTPAITTSATTATAGTTLAPGTCSTAAFCSSNVPVDLAVQTNIQNSSSAFYLFQGNCAQLVTLSAGKLTTVGSAALISSVFIGAPPGPITSAFPTSNKIWIMNPSGQAGANCVPTTGSTTTFTCGGGSANGFTRAEAYFYKNGNVSTWSYYTTMGAQYLNYFFNTQGTGVYINTMMTNNFTTVNSLLNLDGLSMAVFGQDINNKSIAGVLTYPTATQTSFVWATQPGPITSVLTCGGTSG